MSEIPKIIEGEWTELTTESSEAEVRRIASVLGIPSEVLKESQRRFSNYLQDRILFTDAWYKENIVYRTSDF